MKSIVFFDFSTLNYGGGCEKNFMRLGSWLSKRGYKVSFITATREFNDLYCSVARQGKHEQNISVKSLEEDFHVKHYLQFTLKDLLLPTKARKELKNLLIKTDVIYSRNEILEVLILRYFFNVDLYKVVFGFHTPMHYPVARTIKAKLHNLLYTSNVYSYLLGVSKVRSLVLTDEDKKILTKNNPNQRIGVIPNPIDTSIFSQKNYKKGNTFDIYYIGRMTEQKGIDILAESIEKLSLRKEFDNMKFYFLGNGNKDFYLKNIAIKYNNCHFLDFQNDIVSFYQSADITVVPSRWEGFPYSVLEAQACGVSVITTDIPGCRDIVQDNITGWIVSPDNTLSDSIIYAYDIWNNDYNQLIKIGTAARHNVVENYTEEVIDNKIEDFLFKS